MKSPSNTVETLAGEEDAGLHRIKPEISFYGHMMHKLNLVLWAEGGKKPAARKMRTAYSTIYRWVRKEAYPNHINGPRLDALYFLALEKHRLQRQRRRRQVQIPKLRRVVAQPAPDISVDAV